MTDLGFVQLAEVGRSLKEAPEWPKQEAGAHGADGKKHKWNGHDSRGFMGMLAGLVRDALFAPKRQEVSAEGVKGGQTGREQSADKKNEKDAAVFGGAQCDR